MTDEGVPPPPAPASATRPSPPQPAEPVPQPDVNLARAVRRLVSRSAFSAGLVSGLIGAAMVTAGSALLALLFWAAHIQNGCSADVPASLSSGSCTDTGVNGYMINWNALLWQSLGAGQVFGFASGTQGTVRIPLGFGLLLVALTLFFAGRVTVRFLVVRTPREAVLRSLTIAASFTIAMVGVGGAITARGAGLAIGPDYGLLSLWSLGIAFPAAFAGIVRRLFGAAVPRVPLAAARARMGRGYALVAAAVAGLLVALVLATVLGIIAMATHTEDTANIIRSQQVLTTGKVIPDSVLGTVAGVTLLVLALPTIATWVLAYSLIVTTVSVGGLGQTTEYGLTTGSHDAYLWVALLVPLLAGLITGYAAARLWRAGSVEQAVGVGALAGIFWAVLCWMVIVLLDGTATVTGPIGAGGAVGAGATFGPGLQSSFLALLVCGPVLGAVGGYLSLLLLARPVGLPVLRRYNVSVVGAPVVEPSRTCASCGLRLRPDAAFCSRCGAPQAPAPPAPVASPAESAQGAEGVEQVELQ